MASVIPEFIPHKSTVGEKKVFALLESLPEDCVVYYEPKIDKYHPDFVVISPRLGVLVIEVKDWVLANIDKIDSYNVSFNKNSSMVSCKNPERQVLDYLYSFKDLCRSKIKNWKKEDLFYTKELHKGSKRKDLNFAFSYAIFFSNISKDEFNNQKLAKVISDKAVFTKDDMQKLKASSSEEIESALRLCNINFPALTSDKIDILRSIIHPEIKISTSNNGQSEIEEVDVKVLDVKQEKFVKNIGSGHRIIQGVAGSGKTLLLIYRAKWLAKMNEENKKKGKLLLLCFNVQLATYIKNILHKHDIEVFHFDGWAKSLGCPRKQNEQHDDFGERFLKYLSKRKDNKNYQAIFVDEAQDFSASWFKCVVQSLECSNSSDLLIAGDANQSLTKVNKFTWSSVGVNAIGRTISKKFSLNKNYRNTEKIMRVAELFSQKEAINKNEDQSSLQIMNVCADNCAREGLLRPALFKSNSREDEVDMVSMLVEDIIFSKFSVKLPDNIQPEQIGILYPYKDKKLEPLLNKLVDNINAFSSAKWLNQSSGMRFMVNEPGVKIQTMHGSKGLQYKIVIIMWADLLPKRFSSDYDEDYNLFYVAVTRPEDYLFISYSENSLFTEKLRDSKLCD